VDLKRRALAQNTENREYHPIEITSGGGQGGKSHTSTWDPAGTQVSFKSLSKERGS